MPTESLTHNFVINTKEGAERFIRALEEAEKYRDLPRRPCPVKFLTDPQEIAEFHARLKAKYGKPV